FSLGAIRRTIPHQIFGLLRRIAPRLKADGVPVSFETPTWNSTVVDVDLVDLALELGVPVAEPGAKASLDLSAWATKRENDPERPRDPVHLTADPRFAALVERAVDEEIASEGFKTAAGGGQAFAAPRRAWFDRRMEMLRTGLLPAFEFNLSRLNSALSPQ